MKKPVKIQIFQFKHIIYIILVLFLIGSSVASSADEKGSEKGMVTTDGLTVVKSTRDTEMQVKHGVNWSEYTKYQISPVEVSFRKDWKRDYNSNRMSLSQQVTDEDMARIKKTVGKIVYDAFDKALQKEGGFTKVDEADSKTLLFKPRIINLDLYAPDIEHSPVYSETYVRQAGKATLFLEVYDAVSGEILARWVDTREDPDNGYYQWANRITNMNRVAGIADSWARRLVEGLDKLKAVK